MNRQRWIILGFLFSLLVVLAVIFFRGGGRENIRLSSEVPLPELTPEPPEVAEMKSVTLFFLSDEDNLLHAEECEIFASSSVVHEAEQVVRKLIEGSQNGFLSPIPPETKLRQLFITKDGIAYVDFSKEMIEGHPSGSSAELATIYSIVNSLAHNFKSIRRVFILIEGGERDTLGGHIHLGRPFIPLYSLNVN